MHIKSKIKKGIYIKIKNKKVTIMAKMWAGRTSGEINKQADDFNSSISFDKKMFVQDINGSIAHAYMLGAQKIISDSDQESIVNGLTEILSDIQSGNTVSVQFCRTPAYSP